MILRCVCWCIFLCLALEPTVRAQITVTEQGYQNVLISFSPNVPSENGQELIKNVSELLEHTSSVLHTAIGIRIATATFQLPPSWSPEKWEGFTFTPAPLEQTESKSDIFVDATEHSPFGKQPVALQHGGCGVPGHHITLPLEFLRSDPQYPKDKLLAREWLKHRYGVFEENGFKYDDLYPEYYKIPGGSDVRINECTDGEVKYQFKNPHDEEECNPLERDLCRVHPEQDSAANVTSSLMYFNQELQNMAHICGKDDIPHHNTTRSKQNVLCNGQSIWDVVKLSKDFEITQQEVAEEDVKPIQFSFIQPSQPRFVVLLEDSENLHTQRFSIKLALRRFYYDLPTKSKLAIYTFSSEAKKVKEALPYKELPAIGRDDLGSIADFVASTENICSSCGLDKAIETLVQNSEVRKGSIFLITASSLDKLPTTPDDLKALGISLSVLRFAGSEDPVPVDNSYDVLQDKFSSYSYVQILNNLEEGETFESMFSLLKNPVPEFNDFETKTVASGIMSSEKKVTIPENAEASLYTLWVGTQYNDADSITCKVGEADVPLTDGVKGTDISTFTFTPVEGEVSCGLSSARLDPVLTQVRMTTQKGYYFDYDIWIHDKSTDTEQMPIIIYAKMNFGGYPVKYAKVTATITVEKKPEEETQETSNNAEEIVLELLDNGGGDPDVTQHDGIYSGYFTEFVSEGKYQITVKMNDNEGTAKIGKEYPELISATCCGSEILTKNDDVPAFSMERLTEYTSEKKMPEGGYAPTRIVDFRVAVFNHSNYALLTWTAPGGGKAARYEMKLFQNWENAVKNFDTTGDPQNISSIIPGSSGASEGHLLLFNDLGIDSTYYITMRSWSATDKKSDISNVAEFFLSKDEDTTTAKDPSSTPKAITDDDSAKRAQARKRTIEIVVGVLAGIVVLCILIYLGVYFFVQKPKRKEEKARARRKAENGGGSRPTSGATGVNSIPADVIIKHHNEYVEAKNMHKDPPIFKEENLNLAESSPELPENSGRNNKVAQYAMVQKAPEGSAPNSSQQDPSKSPKRMTVV